MLTATYLTGESRPIAGPSIENVPKALACQPVPYRNRPALMAASTFLVAGGKKRKEISPV